VGKKTKIDPELIRQLDAAQGHAKAAGVTAAGPSPVQAVIYLHPTETGQAAVPPDQIQGVVDELLGRVAKAVGEAPQRHNTFRNLGSFAVQAAPGFIRELIRQPEVASAVANRKG
jgi:hypothetical protein